MPRIFGYLRVSTEQQDTDTQRFPVLDYANRHGFAPVVFVVETVSRWQDWKGRELGRLLLSLEAGDVILTTEFTRLGATPGQVFGFLEEAAKRGVILHIVKNGVIMDGSMQNQLLAAAFSMCSMVEAMFIKSRTKDGIERARREGKRIGRPPGSTGKSKLDDQGEVVRGLVKVGLSKRKIAVHLGVSYNTVSRWISHNMATEKA